MKKIISSSVLVILLICFLVPTTGGVETAEETHLVFGTARYSDFKTADNAEVRVESSIEVLTTNVGGLGGWDSGHRQVECSWPIGTTFTVNIIGCCAHPGWEGSKDGIIVDGDIVYGANISHRRR